MKYKKIKRMAAVLCFFTVCTLTIHSVCRLLERKESHVEYSQFWENPGDYDVWLLGTSHVRRSMQVMELWKDLLLQPGRGQQLHHPDLLDLYECPGLWNAQGGCDGLL